jgi:hypothetical protein
MIRKWASDISHIQEQHPIKMIIRDNAGEYRSKDIYRIEWKILVPAPSGFFQVQPMQGIPRNTSEPLKTTLFRAIYGREQNLSKFRALASLSDSGHTYTFTKSAARLPVESIIYEQWKAFTWVLQQKAIPADMSSTSCNFHHQLS